MECSIDRWESPLLGEIDGPLRDRAISGVSPHLLLKRLNFDGKVLLVIRGIVSVPCRSLMRAGYLHFSSYKVRKVAFSNGLHNLLFSAVDIRSNLSLEIHSS